MEGITEAAEALARNWDSISTLIRWATQVLASHTGATS